MRDLPLYDHVSSTVSRCWLAAVLERERDVLHTTQHNTNLLDAQDKQINDIITFSEEKGHLPMQFGSCWSFFN